MDDLAYTGVEAGDVVYPPASASVYTVRTGMTETANYAERMDLVNDKPHGSSFNRIYACQSGDAISRVRTQWRKFYDKSFGRIGFKL